MAKRAIAVLCLFASAVLSNPAADPMVTPDPLLRRQNQAFIGFYKESVIGTSTDWESYGCKTGYTLTTAQNWFKCCPTTTVCQLYTACSGNFLINAGTSFPCTSLASTASCGSDLLFASLDALQPQSYIWCGTGTDKGTNIYKATTTGSSTPPSTPTPSPPSPTPTHKSDTNVGAIAGGVVGGLAVLGLAIGGVVFLCVRRKKHDNVQPAYAGGAEHEKPFIGAQAAEVQAMSPGTQSYYSPPSAYPQQPYSPMQPQQPYGYVDQYGQPINPHNSMYKEPNFGTPSPPATTSPYPSSVAELATPQVMSGGSPQPEFMDPQRYSHGGP